MSATHTYILTIICCVFLFKPSYAAEECAKAKDQDLEFNVFCFCDQGTSAENKDGFNISYTELSSCKYYKLDTTCYYRNEYTDCSGYYCDTIGQTWCPEECNLTCPDTMVPECGCNVPWKCECPEGSGITPGITPGEECRVNSHLSNNIDVTGYKSDHDTCRNKCDFFQYDFNHLNKCSNYQDEYNGLQKLYFQRHKYKLL